MSTLPRPGQQGPLGASGALPPLPPLPPSPSAGALPPGAAQLLAARTAQQRQTVRGGRFARWHQEPSVPQEEETRAITAPVAACINACDGYFLFDMIHLKKADQWSYVKTGIDGVIKKD